MKIDLLSFSLPDVLGRLITAKYEKKSFKETTDKAGKFRCDPRYSFFFFSIEHGQLTVSNKMMHTRLRVRSNAFGISTTFWTTINLPQRRKSNSSMYSWGEEI